ncbi:MAG TPA: hypothetical protein VLG44_03680 [Chlamydiales bacterium]|nr:hypothetical protein [Chlamydiales bacterium]
MSSKILLINTLIQIIKDLHYGKKEEARSKLNKMKKMIEGLNPKLQKDVQNFIIQVTFELDYDPNHLVTEEIKKAADKLLRDLGGPQ